MVCGLVTGVLRVMGATGICGLEEASAAHCRPLFFSSPPHTALFHRDDITGSNGHMRAEDLMKHTFLKKF